MEEADLAEKTGKHTLVVQQQQPNGHNQFRLWTSFPSHAGCDRDCRLLGAETGTLSSAVSWTAAGQTDAAAKAELLTATARL